jgi:hypothetical protein
MQKNPPCQLNLPILKERPKLPTILSISPKPPETHRDPPAQLRDKNTLTDATVRVKKSLKDSIDYAKLTPTQQAAWDAGMYGSIELKQIKGNYYYYSRWKDPATGKKRSTYLSKDWNKAIAKLQKLTTAL